MMTHLSIRFFIGLSQRGDAAPGSPESFGQEAVYDDRAARALAILSAHYPALTATRGTGYWEGSPEPNLVAEVVVDGPYRPLNGPHGPDPDPAVGRAQAVAGEIARALGQDAVALVVAPVRFSLEAPRATDN